MGHNSKKKICNFFVVPRNEQVFLGMPDIDILNILTINCDTKGAKETDKAVTCNTNTTITQDTGCEQHFTNIRQEHGKTEKCYTMQAIIQI